MFNRLEFGDYKFEISLPNSMTFGLDGKTDLYLGKVSLDVLIITLRNQFKTAVKEVGARGIRKEEIERMVEYALNDLKTGEVLKHNLVALERADDVAGFGRPSQSLS